LKQSAQGLKQVSWFDCPGGGQVSVDGTIAYIGHMNAPHGTSIVDVSDPARPRLLASLEVSGQIHSHKVRVANGLMLVNHEAQPADQPPRGARGGLAIYDVSQPGRPRSIGFWQCGGAGVHRFTFDGRYAYISPEMDGYIGNIVMILDLQDPSHPKEIGRWWMPGQKENERRQRRWTGRQYRCHHPIRLGNRLYVSYWHGGFVILDIEDMTRPRFISGLDWSPPYASPTHTVLPLPFPLRGRRFMLAADEDVQKTSRAAPAFLWLVDITEERHPVPISTFQVPGVTGEPQPEFTGCHQPCERITGPEIPVAWFTYGLRIVDVANPHAPREIAHFVPEPPTGQARVLSNDVDVDNRGLIYVIDRDRGLHILERA
jgi:hypothetical protein